MVGGDRSAEEAGRWYIGIDRFVTQLSKTAGRYSTATEIELREAGIRQAPFGIGRRPTHRILYGIDQDTVVVYRVRALKQDTLGIEELTE